MEACVAALTQQLLEKEQKGVMLNSERYRLPPTRPPPCRITNQPAEKRRLNHYESIDYLPPNSTVYRKWLAQQVHWNGVSCSACTACTVRVPPV